MHSRVFVHPRDQSEFEALVRYMMRPPVSLSRLHFTSRGLGRSLHPGARRQLAFPVAEQPVPRANEGEVFMDSSAILAAPPQSARAPEDTTRDDGLTT